MSIIGMDMDGVLVDWNTAWQAELILQTGKDLFGEKFVPHTWHYDKARGYTSEDIAKARAAVARDPKWWFKLNGYQFEPTHKTLADLFSRQMRGDSVYFITDRYGERAKHQTEDWLRYMGIAAPTVLISGEKGAIARALKLDYYIDDKPENLDAVDDDTKGRTRTYLMDRPWNWGSYSGNNRVTSLDEFMDYLPPLL